MIPKTIHYIWLSGEEKPADVAYYMSSWHKILPDYTIKCWDINSFDIDSVPFVRECINVKKWAFAADYIRLYALYTEGGIYLDADMLVLRPFQDLIKDYNFVSAVEYYPVLPRKKERTRYIDDDGHRKMGITKVPGIALQAAFMASIPGHPLLSECMNWYKDKHFIPGGASNGYGITVHNEEIVAPDVYAQCAEQYGFVYKDVEQKLKDGMFILPSSMIASSLKRVSKNAYAIHCCNGAWRRQGLFLKIKRLIKYISIPLKFGVKSK